MASTSACNAGPVGSNDIHYWFDEKMKKLMKRYVFMISDEVFNLERHWQHTLDFGAKRTFYYYMQGMAHTALVYVCYRYLLWYWDETLGKWKDRNPSAALVALLRYTFWEDSEFIEEFLGD